MSTGFYTTLPVSKALNDVVELFGFKEDSFNITQIIIVTEEQFNAISALYLHINSLTEDELSKHDPADLFMSGWFGTPESELFDYRTNLTNTQVLLQYIKDNKIIKDYKLLDLLTPLVDEKLMMISKIIETYAKGIFATKLNYLLEKHSLSQSALAKKLGVKPQTVSLWLQSKGFANNSTAIELCNIFNVSLDFMLRPNVNEKSMDKYILYQNCGLTSESTDILEGMVKDKNTDTLKTLNVIIQSYNKYDGDLLAALTEFFLMPYQQDMYMISNDDLADISYQVASAKNLTEAKTSITSFVTKHCNMDYNNLCKGKAYQVDVVMLQYISQVLTRMKDIEIKKEY